MHAAIAVDSLASQTFLNARKEKPEAQALRAQLANHPKLFPSYLHQLFTILLFGTFSFWPFARPVLAIKLADPAVRCGLPAVCAVPTACSLCGPPRPSRSTARP